MYWKGLPKPIRGSQYSGLFHAADWLPTVISAVAPQHPLTPHDTLPLDGVSMWLAVCHNLTSPRKYVYYGVNQQLQGPAVRNSAGFKLIVGGDGGGAGLWSPEQLPNALHRAWTPISRFYFSSASNSTNSSTQLYHIADDPGERHPLSMADPQNQAAAAELQQIVDQYKKTQVPQAVSDPSCPPFHSLHTTDNPPREFIGPWCDV